MDRIALVALIASLLVSTVSAQEGSSDSDEARALLASAEADYESGRYEAAADGYERFRQALVHAGNERAPLALWNIGLSLSHVAGRERDAIENLERFLSESRALTDDPSVRDMRSEAQEKVDDLRTRLPASSSVHPVGPILLGVGGATLVAGLVTGAVSLSLSADVEGACPATTCAVALRDQYESMRAASTAADVLMVAGGAVAVVGLILTLTVTESESRVVACGVGGCAIRATF